MKIQQEYAQLIEEFLKNLIKFQEFAEVYYHKFLNEKREYSEDIFYILDEVSAVANLTTDNPELLKAGFYSEDYLREIAGQALEKLKALG